jgi:hypothetical protein
MTGLTPDCFKLHTESDCGPSEPASAPMILPAGWKRLDAFAYRYRDGLAVIVTQGLERDGKTWVHLSVSHRVRLPTWEELKAVREVFLGTDSVALQVLPPRSEWVNVHPNVMHLFKCLDGRPVPDFRRQGTL